jgi:preprotein translocase subunit SecA
MGFLDRFFGNANEKELKKYQLIVDQINDLEGKFKNFSDGDIRNKTKELQEKASEAKNLEEILPEAFANCREAGRRVLGERAYDVQLMGALALHNGKISEMKTGEGKTLSAVLAAYTNALTGKGVHVVTVNDYLSRRDTNWMGQIYDFLGLSVGCIAHDSSFIYQPNRTDENEVSIEEENLVPVTRKEAYGTDITYGTNNEFGFDYLRDNMAHSEEQMAQRDLNFVIVDEVDSILIDEARTPLIISAPDMESTKLYEQFAKIAPQLKEGEDYNLDEKLKTTDLTQEGISKVEKLLGVDNLFEASRTQYVHHLEQALKAYIIFKKDRDYVVKEGEIVIVDDFTGRLMPGRRYSEGLHQAIEAKEGVEIQRESRTLASITFQNYFRMYNKISGMTGTALTSAEEFSKVYELEVVQIPTNKPMSRKDLSDVVYKNERGKFKAIVEKIKELRKVGRPVLVGTVAIEKSEALSEALSKAGVPHEVLNAKNHEREAQIIADAGQKGAVTIATNMAGRGTDIKLGEGAKDLGGLYIIGTERHEARRIDNQLRGRSGRQGDPGTTQFYVSLEDELMKRFGGERMWALMDKLGLPEDQPIENGIISKSIESAQSKIEGHNFDIRKQVLEYDDVVNKQREVIYKRRKNILKKKEVKNEIEEIMRSEVENIVSVHTSEELEEKWNTQEIQEEIEVLIGKQEGLKTQLSKIKKSREYSSSETKISAMMDYIFELLKKEYNQKVQKIGEEVFRKIEKEVYLRAVDQHWMEHLDNLTSLRDSTNLQSYGQRDPLIEYKKEGYRLFQDLLANINRSVIKTFFRIQPAENQNIQTKPVVAQENLQFSGASQNQQFKKLENKNQKPTVFQPAKNQTKVGRNDACPCGAKKENGQPKKYKQCCGR